MRIRNPAGAYASCNFDAFFECPSTTLAGQHAARRWFTEETPLPPAAFRDLLFREHCIGKNDSAQQRNIRRQAFHQAFMATIGQIIVEEGRLRATPA